ncbi:FAD/FMN-containing dehydrogenase, partial [Desulfovibrio sp. 1188_IL3213]
MTQASLLNPLPHSVDAQPYADRLEPADMDFLRRTLGEDLLVTAEELHVYASDASLKTGSPLAAARPRRVEQVQDLLAWAKD